MKIEWMINENRKDRYTLFLEGEAWKNIHISIFGHRFQIPHTVTSQKEADDLFNEVEYKRVKYYVLKRLAAQSFHTDQLKKILQYRLVSLLTIQRIIKDLVRWGYLDDQAWIEGFMSSHLKRFSLRITLLKLQSKGIPFSLLQEIQEKWNDPNQEIQLITHLLQTRYRLKNLSLAKEKQKVIGALLRKGYRFDDIKQAMGSNAYE